jgi:WD40 repeat protein
VTATVWDAETGSALGHTASHGPPEDPRTGTHIYHVDVSPDGTLIATASNASVKVWDAVTLKEVFSYRSETGVDDVGWSPDSTRLAISGSSDGVTVVLDRSGKAVGQTREAGTFFPVSAAFSADGALLATGRFQGFEGVQLGEYGVTLWDWRTGNEVTVLDTWGESLTFSPDGLVLATADPTGPARLWDARSGQLLTTLTGHTGGVFDVAFSPDGGSVATAGQDGSVRLWDAETGVQHLTLPGHGNVVHTVQFSPDGTKLASAGADGVVRVWALDLHGLLSIAREKVTRDLTAAECRKYLHIDTCP